jgi:hypothetical protein
MQDTKIKQLFQLGQIVATPGAIDLMSQHEINGVELLTRHCTGDWGEITEDDYQENELSLKEGFRILSAYETKGGKIWIITEADRSATTFLLPSEY